MEVKEDITKLFDKLIHNDQDMSNQISVLYKEIDTVLQSNGHINQKLDNMLYNDIIGGTNNITEIQNFVEHLQKFYNKTELWAKKFTVFIQKNKIKTICDFIHNLGNFHEFS